VDNPVLTKKAFERAEQAVPTSYDAMTVAGTFRKAGVLLVLLVTGAAFGWVSFQPVGPRHVQIPAWSFVALVVAFVTALVCSFRPRTAPFLSPVYALCEGLFLGVISHAFDVRWSGIVLVAVLATAVAFAVTLVLYGLGIVSVTGKFVGVVISATVGIAVLYAVGLLFALGGVDIMLWNQRSALGLLISAAIVVVAALNLFVDYEFIRQSVAAGSPRHMEWFGAFGLMLTLVWLYLEMLRLLAIAFGDD
jgi:uncharacterized YccA/Bax inhibitor family protein